jgi:plastocyanin
MTRFAGIALALALSAPVAGCSGDSSGPGNGGGGQPGTGNVQGSVVVQGAGGLANVTVTLERTGQQTRTATTDNAGQYNFQQVAAGTWTVAVTAPQGYTVSGSSSQSVTVSAGQTATVSPFTLAPPPASMAVTVDMRDNLFTPTPARVLAGGTVTWVNRGAVQHNSTSDTNLWASGNLNPNQSYERTFPTAGTFPYNCTLHPGMNGTIIVQ